MLYKPSSWDAARIGMFTLTIVSGPGRVKLGHDNRMSQQLRGVDNEDEIKEGLSQND